MACDSTLVPFFPIPFHARIFLVKPTTPRKDLTPVWSLGASQATIFPILSSRTWTNPPIVWVTPRALIDLSISLSFLNESFSFAHSILGRKWCRRNWYCSSKSSNPPKKSYVNEGSVFGLPECNREGSFIGGGKAPKARYTASVMVNPAD